MNKLQMRRVENLAEKEDTVVEDNTTGPDTGNLTMTRNGRPPSNLVIKEIKCRDSQRNKCREELPSRYLPTTPLVVVFCRNQTICNC